MPNRAWLYLVGLAVAVALVLWALQPPPAAARAPECGGASWYGPGFHGKRTASGERFNQEAMTAAHKTLPFGARVKVVDQRTGRSVIVRINDRGPYHAGRIIDLSHAAAVRLGMIQAGTAKICLYRL